MIKEQNVAILFLINALLYNIEPNEKSEKVNKLHSQVIKAIRHIDRHMGELYTNAGTLADTAWEKAKKEVDAKNFTVIMSIVLTALYDIMDKPSKKWFTEKTFFSAIRSIEADVRSKGEYDEVLVEGDSSRLSELFAKHLGLSRVNKLALRKKIIEQNLILEGKRC